MFETVRVCVSQNCNCRGYGDSSAYLIFFAMSLECTLQYLLKKFSSNNKNPKREKMLGENVFARKYILVSYFSMSRFVSSSNQPSLSRCTKIDHKLLLQPIVFDFADSKPSKFPAKFTLAFDAFIFPLSQQLQMSRMRPVFDTLYFLSQNIVYYPE